ncbi:hypothetical protein FIV50_01060 [Microbacterium foliorum]|uniref:DUF7701 domain-containing protein n=1 Tax=Microbacterium foliorum TaxID=104336 RepID=A0A4Y5YL99_9MICO|nr:hypothetical protein [Microbacterium foliorum]QDE33514.1 hypothetical protein FIV50_01060 [Microbacterium foliorum]
MNYLAADAARIRSALPEDSSVQDGAERLFLTCAVLMRAKGINVQAEDVHDAWSAWMLGINPRHESIEPYSELDETTRPKDEPFLIAIRRAAAESHD